MSRTSRRRRLQRAGAALLGVLSLLGVLAGGPAQAADDVAGAPGVRVPALRWVGCGQGLQCASATVPLDYDRPHGATIDIALVRLPATDRAHRIGSLFVNPGGPGGSGVDFVRYGGAQLWSPQVRARFDVVGVDPRGVGQSAPVRCFRSNLSEDAFLEGTPGFPVGRRRLTSFVSTWERFDGQCVRDNATIMQRMATADAARDLDVLRAAVGDRALTYDGVSYGSYLGTTYAALFPGRVRALVVDGVLDPVAWATGRGDGGRTPFSSRLGSAEGAYATLQEFLRLCGQHRDQCALAAGGDPAAAYRALIARAERGPLALRLPDGTSVQLTLSDLVGLVLGALYDPGAWPFLGELLAQLATGSPGPAPAAALALVQPPYQNGLDAFLGVSCTDTDNPRDPFRWPVAVAPQDRQTLYFGSAWGYASLPCAVWPARDPDRYTGPFTRRTSSPVLVIGNTYDPATPYAGAQTVAGLLPSSRLLTLRGWGHTSLGKSACVDDRISAYLLRQPLPPPGTVCAPDDQPFAATPATPDRTAARAALDLVNAVNQPRR